MTFVVSESSCHSQRVFDPSKSERLLPCMILIDTFHFSDNYIFFLEKDKNLPYNPVPSVQEKGLAGDK